MDFFPSVPGLSWSVTKTPKFATRTQTSISGRQLRVVDQPMPIWTWSLTYEFLRDQNDTRFGSALGTGYDELRTIAGFFLRQQGAFNTWLYTDPTDDFAANQGIGVGNGVTVAFPLIRTFGGVFSEFITQPQLISGVFLNGIALQNASQGGPPNWTLGANGLITFAPAPAAGVVITATFTYAFPVHFLKDENEFENFMYQLWSLKKLEFESVLLP